MNTLQTWTSVSTPRAHAVLDALLEHLAGHEMFAHASEGGWILDYEGARIRFLAEGGALRASIMAPSPEKLFDARMMAHHHIAEFAACEPDTVRWEGDQPAFERPPAFRVLTAVSFESVSPQLRRVRFRGTDLDRYATNDNLHCKLFFPQPGVTEPEWPVLGPDGLARYPAGEKRLDMRTYTVRRIDPTEGWLEIEFVLHEDAGPGSEWAARARPGQQVGMMGPGGRSPRPAAWMLLASDETGLPAIRRITEGLPRETQGEVIIEVQSANDEVPLDLPAGMSLTWLHRGDEAPGTSAQLQDAVMACSIPRAGDRYAWVAAEFSAVQVLRPWLRDTVGLQGKDQLVVAYWRRGMDETQMKSGGSRRSKDMAADKGVSPASTMSAAA